MSCCSPTALLALPADITLAGDQSVSANHAELRRSESGTWTIRDLGSSNGTAIRLSAERVSSRSYILRPGHRLTLGSGPKASELAVHRFRRGIAERRGKRPTMEDACVACDPLPLPSHMAEMWGMLSFYAVYDGHAGPEASAFAKLHLHRNFVSILCANATSRQPGGAGDSTIGKHGTVAGAGCGGSSLQAIKDVADALRDAFTMTDEQFMQQTQSTAGSTAVVAVVTGTHVIVANCGDSRACLWRNGRCLPLSVDHKPDRPDELQRIKAAGGWVSHGRVLHILAVSRSLGDREFKYAATSAAGMPITADLVSGAPDIRVCRAQQGDELLLACDGLWDVMTGDGAFEFLHSHGGSDNPQRAVAQLVQAADEQFNSLDNITACYVRLSSAR